MNTLLFSTFILATAVAFVSCNAGSSWSYHNIGQWGTLFPYCKGMKQSPINFKWKCEKCKEKSAESKLRLHVDETFGSNGTFVNNGHSVQLNFNPGRYILHGIHQKEHHEARDLEIDTEKREILEELVGIDEEKRRVLNVLFDMSKRSQVKGYVIDQLHFHWGSSDSVGSEHTVNGNHLPMEMHIVTHREEYQTLELAVASNNMDALAVLGFFFEVTTDHENSKMKLLNILTDELQNIATAGQSKAIPNFNLEELVKDSLENSKYLRYSGSLTTPPCSEVVVWTLFEDKLKVSSLQMAKFRSVNIGNNFRNVQNLNSRQLTFYKE